MKSREFIRPTSVILVLSLVVPFHAQQRTDWKDPSSHVGRFVTVSDDVRLEVLDWGGSGRPLVLLPGGGDSARLRRIRFETPVSPDGRVGRPRDFPGLRH